MCGLKLQFLQINSAFKVFTVVDYLCLYRNFRYIPLNFLSVFSDLFTDRRDVIHFMCYTEKIKRCAFHKISRIRRTFSRFFLEMNKFFPLFRSFYYKIGVTRQELQYFTVIKRCECLIIFVFVARNIAANK